MQASAAKPHRNRTDVERERNSVANDGFRGLYFKNACGAKRGMAGEIELFNRGEDTDADAFGALDCVITALNEGGLREIKFARNGLHFPCAEAGGVKHNGERVALERRVGEYVDDEIVECHFGEPSCGGIVALSRRNGLW
jgi:hypothetical protein